MDNADRCFFFGYHEDDNHTETECEFLDWERMQEARLDGEPYPFVPAQRGSEVIFCYRVDNSTNEG